MATYEIYNLQHDLLATQLIGTKSSAIKYGRTIAAELRHSVEVYKAGNKFPICICEYPNWLNAIGKLNWKDIVVNKIDQ